MFLILKYNFPETFSPLERMWGSYLTVCMRDVTSTCCEHDISAWFILITYSTIAWQISFLCYIEGKSERISCMYSNGICGAFFWRFLWNFRNRLIFKFLTCRQSREFDLKSECSSRIPQKQRTHKIKTKRGKIAMCLQSGQDFIRVSGVTIYTVFTR